MVQGWWFGSPLVKWCTFWFSMFIIILTRCNVLLYWTVPHYYISVTWKGGYAPSRVLLLLFLPRWHNWTRRFALSCCRATSEKTGLAEELSYAASPTSKLLYFATFITIAFTSSIWPPPVVVHLVVISCGWNKSFVICTHVAPSRWVGSFLVPLTQAHIYWTLLNWSNAAIVYYCHQSCCCWCATIMYSCWWCDFFLYLHD